MVFAVILAGGSGTRMGNSETPKQYMKLAGKPVIIHTLEKFFVNPRIDHILVLTPKAWVSHTANMVKEFLGETDRVTVLEGGATRNGTLSNAVSYITEHFGEEDDTILVTHDAVRPFLTRRIINENIDAALESGACDTVVPASDTIVRSADGDVISEIPPRAELYQGQTPQSFNCKKLRTLMESLTPEEEKTLTDACKIFVLKGEPVKLVRGEPSNIKLTVPFDMKLAATMLDGDLEGDTEA